jgi:peroxiredoxin
MSDYFYYTDYYAKLFSDGEKETQMSVGQLFADLEMMDLDGKSFILSQIIGNHDFVLLDFWASWCAPCMLAVPRLKKLYDKFERQTLEMVGVSLDDEREKWLNAIKNNDMNWIQISDLKMWESVAAKTYSVDTIPMTILIDKTGKIVGRDLNIAEIEKHIDYNNPKNE